MSLKDFHVLFIVSAILLAFGFSLWSTKYYFINQHLGYLTTAVVSLGCAISLIIYEINFIKKADKFKN